MSKFDFSAEEHRQFSALVTDLVKGEYSLRGDEGERITRKDLENHLRELFTENVCGGLNFRKALRRNEVAIYEIVEEIIDIVVGENFLKSDFIAQFVEYKNRALNDRTDWYTDGDALLSVASFANNHWDTNRQSFDSGEKFTLPSEAAFIHVYGEFERFLLGIESFDKLVDVITKSFERYFDERIFAQFQNVESAVPAEFSVQGNSEDAVLRLCELLEVYGGYNSLVIAGTASALRKLDGMIPASLVSDNMRDNRNKTGFFGTWNGYSLMRIPQVKKNDAFELALDNNKLFVLGGDTKPIKFEYIGDTRTKIVDDYHVNNDMTLDMQVHTRFAMGMLLPSFFGVVTLAE